MIRMKYLLFLILIFLLKNNITAQVDPDTSQAVPIDRFSKEAGTLQVRDSTNGLPGPNEPVNFDQGPFITRGLSPDGKLIAYYNFDVQPTVPAPIYVLFRTGEDTPVAGQLNIIDVIPGEKGYNDFWNIVKVMVPANYIANTITSYDEIMAAGYPMENTNSLVNCPVVPAGSTAKLRYDAESPGLTRGWYDNMVVYYFNFSEKSLVTNSSGIVPVSPIYVSFNINPGQPGGGPPSGFKSDPSGRTHNVVATLPEDAGYSPLWSVNVYDNADFIKVSNIQSVGMANILATGVANVNCPVVAKYTSIDRFSSSAGTLQVRDSVNGLPGPNVPTDFDKSPFITEGLGPAGEFVSYYNFDVQPTDPAPIYVLFREGDSAPVDGQMNIIDVIPGEKGYNDFWEINKVTVPANYAVNTIRSYDEIKNAGYPVEKTTMLVNCPVVPEGSSTGMRLNGESPELTEGWYDGEVVTYFNFFEKALTATNQDMIPVSPIYVSFNTNPDQPGGGPPSGFKSESSGRTHNVVSTLPQDAGYSPLWSVNVYDNADFGKVHNLQSISSVNVLATGVANVNCPVVSIASPTDVKNENKGIPSEFRLDQNFPNPFNPQTTISYSIPQNGFVKLKIYDAIGREVKTLVNEFQNPGTYKINFDGSNLSSGIYFYRIQAGNFTSTKKLILLK